MHKHIALIITIAALIFVVEGVHHHKKFGPPRGGTKIVYQIKSSNSAQPQNLPPPQDTAVLQEPPVLPDSYPLQDSVIGGGANDQQGGNAGQQVEDNDSVSAQAQSDGEDSDQQGGNAGQQVVDSDSVSAQAQSDEEDSDQQQSNAGQQVVDNNPIALPVQAQPANGIVEYVFAMTWPGAECLGGNCGKRRFHSDTWVMHGLWANGRNPLNGQIVDLNYCSGTNPLGDYNAVRQLYGVSYYWKSYNGRDKRFMTAQWNKHGSCCGMSPKDYFEKTVELAELYNPYNLLADGYLYPHNNEESSCDHIKFHIETVFGKRVQVITKGDELSEVRLCFDSNFVPADCSRPSFCGRWAVYKPIPIDNRV